MSRIWSKHHPSIYKIESDLVQWGHNQTPSPIPYTWYRERLCNSHRSLNPQHIVIFRWLDQTPQASSQPILLVCSRSWVTRPHTEHMPGVIFTICSPDSWRRGNFPRQPQWTRETEGWNSIFRNTLTPAYFRLTFVNIRLKITKRDGLDVKINQLDLRFLH